MNKEMKSKVTDYMVSEVENLVDPLTGEVNLTGLVESTEIEFDIEDENDELSELALEIATDYEERSMPREFRTGGRVKCAWCGKHISGPRTGEAVSHGICPKCESTLFSH